MFMNLAADRATPTRWRKRTRKAKVTVGSKGRAKTAASKKTAPGQIASRFEAGRSLDFLRDLPV